MGTRGGPGGPGGVPGTLRVSPLPGPGARGGEIPGFPFPGKLRILPDSGFGIGAKPPRPPPCPSRSRPDIPGRNYRRKAGGRGAAQTPNSWNGRNAGLGNPTGNSHLEFPTWLESHPQSHWESHLESLTWRESHPNSQLESHLELPPGVPGCSGGQQGLRVTTQGREFQQFQDFGIPTLQETPTGGAGPSPLPTPHTPLGWGRIPGNNAMRKGRSPIPIPASFPHDPLRNSPKSARASPLCFSRCFSWLFHGILSHSSSRVWPGKPPSLHLSLGPRDPRGLRALGGVS